MCRPGVTIGQHSYIEPGSVVFNNIPEFAVASGNPARVDRFLSTQDGGVVGSPRTSSSRPRSDRSVPLSVPQPRARRWKDRLTRLKRMMRAQTKRLKTLEVLKLVNKLFKRAKSSDLQRETMLINPGSLGTLVDENDHPIGYADQV